MSVIKIIIEISDNIYAQVDKDMLNQLVQKYIDRLIDDLDLPPSPEVTLGLLDPKDETGYSFLRVIINGNICRIPSRLNNNDQFEHNELASDIIEVILFNRELLINQTVSDSVYNLYISNSNSSLKNISADDLNNLFITMVKHGFKLGRCKDFTIGKKKKTKNWHYIEYFEWLFKDVRSTSIRVCYNTQYNELIKSSSERFAEMFVMMQDGLFYELGIVFPKVEWKLDNGLDNNEFQIRINDLNYLPTSGLNINEFLVNDTVDRLTLINVNGKEAINPANGTECAIVNGTDVEICESAGLTTWDSLGYLILYLSSQLRRRAGCFLTIDVTENILDSLKLAFPALVDSVLSKYDLFTVTRILRDLLDEEISIRDLRSILDHLLILNGITNVDISKYIVFYPEGTNLVPMDREKISDLEITDYSEYIRMAALKSYISHKYTRGGNTLVVYLLDQEIEKIIKNLKNVMPDDAVRIDIIRAIYNEIGNLPPTAQNPVILTTHEIRSRLRRFIEIEFPYLAVVSYSELRPDINIQPISRITLD